MKLIYIEDKDELTIKAENDREKEKYKIQPEEIKTLIELFPNEKFTLTPYSCRVDLEGILSREKIVKLLDIKKPKFISVGNDSSVSAYVEFEPVDYYSDNLDYIKVRREK